MRVGPAAWVCLLGGVFAGCATGTAADDTAPIDSGSKVDASGVKDSSSPPKDSSSPPKDTGGPPVDSGGNNNCGGQCLGNTSTCCNNTCVDITADPNNCGGCGNPCGAQSCCAGNCVDTMGSDTANCGGCGVTCSGTCTNGVCQTGGGNCTIDMGTCSHSPCTAGGALSASCDSNDEGMVAFICFIDVACCTTQWDAQCVSYAQSLEVNMCQGGGC